MKTSLRWLNQYLPEPVSAEQAAELLEGAGFPVEDIESLDDGDVRLDVEVTSNRPDMLSHLGVARELAALKGVSCEWPEVSLKNSDMPVAKFAKLRVENPACSHYVTRVIRGVKVGPSSEWLRQAVEAAGLRSVSNVVDVTNYVMLECGQPLHAFDLDKLAEQTIVVREAIKGEKFAAIDDSTHTLEPPTLVIADANTPQAVAGVMGGSSSEVDENTINLWLESAAFDPLAVRRASRTLRLHSDSSYRFERIPDPAMIEWASRRASQLILQEAGGELCADVLEYGTSDLQPVPVRLHSARTSELLGMEIDVERQYTILNSLGLNPSLEGADIICQIPSFRRDLRREVDLIEEVIRHVGMDKLPVHDTLAVQVQSPQDSVQARRIAQQVMVAHGYYETITPSLVPARHCLPDRPPVHLFGDKGARREGGTLRNSVLCGLLACVRTNQAVGNEDLCLFELASCWSQAENGTIDEFRHLSFAWEASGEVQDALRAVRSVIDALVVSLAGSNLQVEVEAEKGDSTAPWAKVLCAGRLLGRFGVVGSKWRKAFELQGDWVVAELDWHELAALYPPKRESLPLARFPATDRDLTVLCPETLSYVEIEKAILGVDMPDLVRIDFVTTYRGKPIEKGSKAVTLRLLFQHDDRTLRAEEVEPQMAAAIRALEAIGAHLRA